MPTKRVTGISKAAGGPKSHTFEKKLTLKFPKPNNGVLIFSQSTHCLKIFYALIGCDKTLRMTIIIIPSCYLSQGFTPYVMLLANPSSCFKGFVIDNANFVHTDEIYNETDLYL